MTALLFIFILLLLTGAIAGPIVYARSRSAKRDQKNYERGLKMVPLLIHLPPAGEDTNGGGRDTRDVVDENISKAQVIYNIIASTVQEENFKNKVYGQRHFGFEIVGNKGFVHFYAAVPISLIEVVKQAIVSAYPAARLEEVPEHNIFSPTGKLSGTVGGELKLKEEFAYPIATYQDLKRDAMQAMLNALSTLDKEDGAAIQILMRPADPEWRKTANKLASEKRKGKDEAKKGADQLLGIGRDLATAFVKPPESKDEKKEEKKNDLSSLDQAILDSIDDKTRYPGYEVVIRVLVSSNISQRSQAILNNIIAAFSLFDAPGKNGFKYEAAEEISDFVTSYLLRFFPQTDKENVLNSVELATIFHFPDQKSIPTSQLERQDSKQVDGPRNVPEDGLLLGYNVFRGVRKPIRLSKSDRQRHMYAVGQTGTGKSTFLENLAFQDMLDGNGFAFVDPHGDTAERLLAMVPKERTEDVIYFCPSDTDYPMGLNLFEYKDNDQVDFLIQEVLNMLYKLYDPQRQGIIGPRYEHLFRNAALTIMADPNGGTFIDIPKLFSDKQFVKQKLQHVKDPNVLDFWNKEMPQSQKSNEFGEVVSWFVSKFGAFLSNAMMRNIIGQRESAFDLREIMDEGKILLVNLSKGKTGQLNTQLLGMMFVMKFHAAAMSRANIPEEQRRDFALYVDEFQNFSTDSFASILSEARKYHLNLIVANQFTTQLTQEIRDAVFGNVGTVVSFRIGQQDVETLVEYFKPTFETGDLLRIPNHNAIVRTMISGVPTQPFSLATIPPLGSPNYKLAEALKQLTAAKYGRPRAAVEKEIFARLTTKPEPPKFGGNGFGQRPAGSTGNRFMPPAAQDAPARPKPGQPSFLDDWMSKRQTAPGVASQRHVDRIAPSAPTMPAMSHHNQSFADSWTAKRAALPQSSQSSHQPTAHVPQRNISSDSYDKAEVDTIAQQLKHDFKPTHHVSAPQNPQPEPAPQHLVPVQTQPPRPAQVPAVMSQQQQQAPQLPANPPVVPTPVPQASAPAPVLSHDRNAQDDTIFIDQDGNFQVRE
jgi:hypothetical protein